MPPLLEVVDLHKSFGPIKVLRGVDLALAAGEVRFLETLDAASEWEAHKALLRQTAPRRPAADAGEETNNEAPVLVGMK